MNDCKEKNIRNLLKSVYDLYDEVYDFIFTTYGFEPDFFEEHIISYLMGNDKKISTIGDLNATNDWINENNISVYYDKAALSSGSTCLTIPVYPQHVSTGVFHPKVVLVFGKLKNKDMTSAYIIVSSCNLTVSGYGRNQEAFSCVQITNRQVARSVLDFVNKLSEGDDDRHLRIVKFLSDGLKHNKFSNSKTVEFFWNYGNSGITMCQKICELSGENMTVVSPYYDENGPEKLVEELSIDGKLTILPAVDGEFYNIHKSNYESLKSSGVKFAELRKIDNKNRFIHAKLISKGNYCIVGSYNFTTAAMKNMNAEAALIFFQKEKMYFHTSPIDENRFLPENELINNQDENDSERIAFFASMTVDWNNNSITIDYDLPKERDKYIVQLDGAGSHRGWSIDSKKKQMISKIDNQIARLFLKHKFFTVYMNDRACFKGLISEKNWQGVRPEIGCENLDETLAEWYYVFDKKSSGRAYELKCISDDDALTEVIIGGDASSSTDVFDNYYLVSRALGYLVEQVITNKELALATCPVQRRCPRYYTWYSNRKKGEKALYGILFTYPGSIARIVSFMEEKNKKSDSNDIVYMWIISKYLSKAIKFMPSALEGIELFKTKKREIKKKITKLESQYETEMKEEALRDLSKEYFEEYLRWIEKELFRNEA
ncbi:MAG: phospholipase D-like domain-containing protein [Eubacteriales bacterium]|nr:phospholipase D-like domain-containing protein [Eubacteriales bacterium]